MWVNHFYIGKTVEGLNIKLVVRKLRDMNGKPISRENNVI